MNNKSESAKEKEAEKICKRCRRSYLPSSNDASSCHFHPSFFVCRRHDDQKRYYELGPDDPPYAAKFYDCCGAEDPAAPGCTKSSHLSYDDHQCTLQGKSQVMLCTCTSCGYNMQVGVMLVRQ